MALTVTDGEQGRAQATALLPAVSRETLDRLGLYADLLAKWQPTVNLVGPKTIAEAWQRHIIDSLQLVPLLPQGARRLADFGSGAGFPGLVLAIVTGLETHLVESDVRKSAFLREVARQTAAPATVHVRRVEAVEPLAADVITARALAPLSDLLGLALPHWAAGGTGIFPKGENWQQEVTSAAARYKFEHQTTPSRTAHGAVIVTVKDVTA
jgi:16S rRNA (guanine527-N7)-methyltransferase